MRTRTRSMGARGIRGGGGGSQGGFLRGTETSYCALAVPVVLSSQLRVCWLGCSASISSASASASGPPLTSPRHPSPSPSPLPRFYCSSSHNTGLTTFTPSLYHPLPLSFSSLLSSPRDRTSSPEDKLPCNKKTEKIIRLRVYGYDEVKNVFQLRAITRNATEETLPRSAMWIQSIISYPDHGCNKNTKIQSV